MFLVTRTLSAAVALALASSLTAQLRWEVLPTPVAPAARFGHASTDWGCLFGGSDGQQLFNDSWLWRGTQWLQLTPPTAPPARTGHAMAGATLAGSLGQWSQFALLFGGEDLASNKDGSTWMLTHWLTYSSWGQPIRNAAWQQLNPTAAPSPRSGHAMVVAGGPGTDCLLFGGETAQGLSDETWLFSAGNWQLLATQHRPPARRGHVLLADAVAGFRLLGGSDGTAPVATSWLFDGTDWHQEASPGVAAEQVVAGRTPRDSHLVLASHVGGGMPQTSLHERTSEGYWLTQEQVGVLPERTGTALFRGWDVATLFGGRDANGAALGDTLQLTPVHPATTEWLGTGCGAGPCNSGPLLNAGELRLGRRTWFTVLTANPNSVAAFLLQLGSAMPLGPCQVSVTPDLVHAGLVDAWGNLLMPLDVPHLPALRGLPLSTQCVALALDGSLDRGLAISPLVVQKIGD